MFIMVLGAYLCVLPLLSPAAGDSVYGVVRDATTGDALAGVEVEAPALGGTVTDRAGVYVIRTSGPGFRRLRFSRSGFAEFAVDVAVPEHRSLEVNVALDPVPVTLPRSASPHHPRSRPARPGITPPRSDSAGTAPCRCARTHWSHPTTR